MRKGFLRVVVVLTCWLLAVPTQASHIYGGNMSLQATATPGFYKLSLTLFFDKRNADPSAGYDPPTVYIFRKKDNSRVKSLFLPQDEQQDLFKNTPACTNLLPLDLLRIRYSATINLTSSEYNDPQGYYVIWERCCRNRDIVNIQNAGSTGMVFRMDFSAVVQNGIGFQDSSPDFSIPPADYVCINKPFKTSFKATDADGDQLQYELVDPLAGYTSEFPEINRIGSGLSRASYPPISWNSGFSASKAIPGSPTLQINPTTGELTLTATQPGLYTFAVLVREFRNAKEIGQVRREFQLPVVDCKLNQTVPTPPVITANGQPGPTFQHCDTAPLTLSIQPETDYEYQWQRDGLDLEGETNPTLSVSEVGNYSVQKKFLRNCGRDTVSQAVAVFCQVQVFMPTAFTPNGDGQNDSWNIYHSQAIPEMEVTVYDRWGNVVFYSKGYDKPWDGTYQTQKVPIGPYSYLIQVPNQKPYRGSVQVLY